MTDNALSDLHEAGMVAALLVAGVADDEWSAPTPCPEWTVADLVRHVLAGNRLNSVLLRGERPARWPDPTTMELPAAFGLSVADLDEAFGRPEALQRKVALPVGTVPGAVALDLRVTELLVHGWDVAQATGQDVTVPERAAQRALAFSREFIHRIPPGRQPFAASHAAPDDATVLDRLVALLGRDVSTAG